MKKFRVMLFLILGLTIIRGSDVFAMGAKEVQFEDGTSSSWRGVRLNSYMDRLASAASGGAGRLVPSETSPYCYKAVKQIIAKGLGKDLECVRGIITGGKAIDAVTSLPQAGFVMDMTKCRTPGAIRVYKGVGTPAGFKRQSGDTAGHIEVVGEDGWMHSFYNSPVPLDESIRPPGRRPLVGCYVADPEKISTGPISKCPDNYGSALKSGSGSGMQ